MTATQVFLLFLKKNCILQEYLFFRNIIMNDNGNKYFRKRRLYKNTFVEDYLSRNNRTLSNFMTRIFILAPNLINKMHENPRYDMLKKEWCEKNRILFGFVPPKRNWKEWKASGLYLVYYRKLWNKFLRECVDDTEKKISSPFKKNETYNFRLKSNGKNYNI